MRWFGKGLINSVYVWLSRVLVDKCYVCVLLIRLLVDKLSFDFIFKFQNLRKSILFGVLIRGQMLTNDTYQSNLNF